MKMRHKAFTFIEMLIVVICIGVVVSLGGLSFKKARDNHRVDTFVQELLILRSAFSGYYEMYQKFPTIDENQLTKDTFKKLHPFWFPFNPDHSQIQEGAGWYGKTSPDLDEIYLTLKTTKETVSFNEKQVESIKKKVNNGFFIESDSSGLESDSSGLKCFIFKEDNP